MTTAHFTKRDGYHEIIIDGHAGYSKPDIVCAAASMLACTLISMMTEDSASFSDVSEGRVYLKTLSNLKTDIITETVKRGYRLLGEKYPENVRLKEDIHEPDNRKNKS